MKDSTAIPKKLKTVFAFAAMAIAVSSLLLVMLPERGMSLSPSERPESNEPRSLPNNMKVFFEKGLLSVSVKEADLMEVLKEISRQSHVEIKGRSTVKEKVTLEFGNLPLEKGLKRLLKNKSYFFTYAESKDPRRKAERYVLSRVVLLDKSASIQRGNDQTLTTPEKTEQRRLRQDDVLLEHLSDAEADFVRKLLGQEPGAQEATLKALAETVNERLQEIYVELAEALEEGADEGKRDTELEAVQKILQELELGKIETRSDR